MIHSLLGIAAVIFVIWFIFVVFAHTGGVLINLLDSDPDRAGVVGGKLLHGTQSV